MGRTLNTHYVGLVVPVAGADVLLNSEPGGDFDVYCELLAYELGQPVVAKR